MKDRTQRMLPVLAVGATGAIAATLTYAVSPASVGFLPPCPLNALFGIDCPLCGGMRGAHALLHGDLASAADHNIALFLIVPLLVAALTWWAVQRWYGGELGSQRRVRIWMDRVAVPALLALALFGLVRNFVPYLGSGGAL